MNSLAFLATVGPKCNAMEMYKRAKDRLFGAMYGKDSECAMEAYFIMHKLKKKAFGIWSPFQMEDFLDYPVVPNAEQKAQEFTQEATFLQSHFGAFKRFQELGDRILATTSQGLGIQAFGRKIREQPNAPRPQVRDFKVQGTGVF